MVEKLLLNSTKNRPLIWAGAGVVSLSLLSLVIAQVDIAQATQMLESLSWRMLACACVLLALEGVATALRLWLFAQRCPCLSAAMKANAWYVLLLVVLPARLGEVAAIVVLERYLGQKHGAAAMSIIAQRLYDVIVLSVIFFIALLGLGDFVDYRIMSIAALVLIAFASIVLLRLEMFLTLVAVMFQRAPKKLYRLLLQARLYSRHGLNRRDVPLALFFTGLKWISNLGALAFLFMALHLGLTLYENITVAAAYNFLAIVPLQTIGGIGVGEAGLTLLLAGMGLTAATAAGASLMIRFVILIFPFVFFVLVMVAVKVKDKLGV